MSARVALLDVWGLRRDAAARPVIERELASPQIALRIAALEALLRFGRAARPVLEPLLKDESGAVQRALLHAIQKQAACDPRWIKPVLAYFATVTGLPRADALATLEALCGGSFGDDPARWAKWFKENHDAIENGKLKPPHAKNKKEARGTSFYGLETPSNRILFALDGGWSLNVPSRVSIQRRLHWYHWKNKNKNEEIHRDVFARELRRTLGRLSPQGRFGILMVGHARNKEDVVGLLPEKGTLGLSARDVARAVRFVKEYRYSGINYDIHFALLTACDSSEADTIFLVNNGLLKSGRYLLPEALVADFKRRNRIRRFVLHAIRLCDTGAASEALMKGLADSSGGSYTWAKNPPPPR